MLKKITQGILIPIALVALTSFGLTPGAFAQMSETSTGNTASGLSSADRTFVKEAAQGGMAEVELGQLAVQKASSPDVKQFGQRMVDDHSKANDQLKQVASEKGVTLPSKLSVKDAATKAKLEKLSGDSFDRAYMKDMVKDHTKDVSAFQKESQNGQDPAVKNFASQTLPTLQDHLNQAQSIAPKTEQSSKSGGTH